MMTFYHICATIKSMDLHSIRKANIKNKRVLLRADFNVPIARLRAARGQARRMVADDFRIRQTIPTIRLLLRRHNGIVLITHLGRPNNAKHETRNMRQEILSVQPIARYLSRILRKKIHFIKDPFSRDGLRAIRTLKPGEIAMIENIRFWKGEEQNSHVFAKQLACLGDVFVNDAFGASHRAHASVTGITKFLPSYAGLLLEKEVQTLERVMKRPGRPYLAILGGVKIADKLPLLLRFLRDADGILLAGALANTVLAKTGFQVGRSHKDSSFRNTERLYQNRKILFPCDAVVAKKLREGTKTRIRKIGEVARDEMILDLGPKTLELFSQSMRGAKTIVWNGPVGMTDYKTFSAGTIALAKALKKIRAFKVVGGGDTVAVLRKYNLLSGFSHVSTGGGAMLEFLVGKKLPGVEALKQLHN